MSLSIVKQPTGAEAAAARDRSRGFAVRTPPLEVDVDIADVHRHLESGAIRNGHRPF